MAHYTSVAARGPWGRAMTPSADSHLDRMFAKVKLGLPAVSMVY